MAANGNVFEELFENLAKRVDSINEYKNNEVSSVASFINNSHFDCNCKVDQKSITEVLEVSKLEFSKIIKEQSPEDDFLHLNYVHQEVEQSDTEEKGKKFIIFACNICGEVKLTKRALRTHVNKNHTAEGN